MRIPDLSLEKSTTTRPGRRNVAPNNKPTGVIKKKKKESCCKCSWNVVPFLGASAVLLCLVVATGLLSVKQWNSMMPIPRALTPFPGKLVSDLPQVQKMFPTLSKVQRIVSNAQILSTFLKSCMNLVEYQVETNLKIHRFLLLDFLLSCINAICFEVLKFLVCLKSPVQHFVSNTQIHFNACMGKLNMKYRLHHRLIQIWWIHSFLLLDFSRRCINAI